MQAHEAVTEGLLVVSALILILLLCLPVPTETGPSVKPVTPAATPAVPVQPVSDSSKTTSAPADAKRPVQSVARTDLHTRVIVVSVEDRRLALLEDGKVKATYRVAVGKDATPSPVGTFRIVQRVSNPTYYHKGEVIPPGPGNPIGDRWMGLSRTGYGIHGTNRPASIGRAASHGCIRMSRADLEQLFAQVRVGDTVQIVGSRDAQTVALFGAPAVPVVGAAAPAVVAQSVPQTDRPVQPAAAGATSTVALTAAAVPAVAVVGQ